MKVIHAEFLRKFPEIELRPFYLFIGPETYPLGAFFNTLTQRINASGIKRYDGSQHKVSDVLAATSAGLFGQFRVPVVFDAHKMRGFGKLLQTGFTGSRPLVGVFNPSLKKRQSPVAWLAKFTGWEQDFLDSMCYIVELPYLDDSTFEKWVAKQLKIGGVERFRRMAFNKLVQSLPRDLASAKNELDKITAFLGGQDMTDWQEIAPLVCFQPEVLEYQMADSFVAGDANSAVAQMDAAVNSGTKPEQAISSFTRGLKAMCWAKLGVGSMVKPAWKVKKYQEMSKNISKRDGLELLRISIAAEAGVRKGQNPVLTAYNLLLKIRR